MNAVPGDAVIVKGEGPTVILVHGTATDAATWTIQMTTLTGLRLVAYHRRGTPAWPVDDVRALSTSDHADDLAEIIREFGGDAPTLCGSSYGGVIVLELLRRNPELAARAVVCEPPLPPSSDSPAVPADWIERYEQEMVEHGGPAAAELFLRTVLSDDGWARLPQRWQERSKALWRQIDSDVHALAATKLDYADLASCTVPVLFLGGAKSPAMYGETLEVLSAAMPAAKREVLAGAGHMMHADAARTFNRLLAEWVRN